MLWIYLLMLTGALLTAMALNLGWIVLSNRIWFLQTNLLPVWPWQLTLALWWLILLVGLTLLLVGCTSPCHPLPNHLTYPQLDPIQARQWLLDGWIAINCRWIL